MKTEAADSGMLKPYVRHPYAFVSQEDEEPASDSYSLEQKRAYFRTLQNPHAYYAIFGEPDNEDTRHVHSDIVPVSISRPLTLGPVSESTASRDLLQKALDDVLKLYRPYVAKADWERIRAYRPIFLEAAGSTMTKAKRVTQGLERLKFSLMPEERVEYNRAPATKVIDELKKLLV